MKNMICLKKDFLQNSDIIHVTRAGNEFGDGFHMTMSEEINGVKKIFPGYGC